MIQKIQPPGLQAISISIISGVVSALLSIVGCNNINDDTVTDIDGNIYHTIKIGNQVWMSENLKVTRYRNGDSVLNAAYDTAWSNVTTGSYCSYNNDTSLEKTYGKLYNWYAVTDARNLAPQGWHIATPEEVITLMEYVGGDTIAGAKMKEAGPMHWLGPNEGTTNEFGFTALPGGYRFSEGTFHTRGSNGYWWSRGRSYEMYTWSPRLYTYFADIERDYRNKNLGLSVRCLKD
jgi:uncharacterized protein (TIGR02145 family)